MSRHCRDGGPSFFPEICENLDAGSLSFSLTVQILSDLQDKRRTGAMNEKTLPEISGQERSR